LLPFLVREEKTERRHLMHRFLFAGLAAALSLVASTPNQARASWLSEALHAYYDPGYYGYGPGYGYYNYAPGYSYYDPGYSGYAPGYGYSYSPGYSSYYYAPNYGYAPRYGYYGRTYVTPYRTYGYGPGYYRGWYGRGYRGRGWHGHEEWHGHHHH